MTTDQLAEIHDAAATTRMSEAFYGTVMLVTTVQPPWVDHQLSGLTGMCQVIPAKLLMGAEVNNRDANWAVLITGKNVTMGIPGCQVRMMVRQNNPDQRWDLNPDIVELP
jgi:hypothetical protein